MIDRFQTPVNVSKYMVSLLPEFIETVLEPTKGNGNLVKELFEYKVEAPNDFFSLDKNKTYDAVVMNPPFSSKSANLENAPLKYVNSGMKCGYYILFECMQKSNIIIALMPWYTISDSDVRLRRIKSFGLKSVTLLPRKTFNYTRIQTCVFELNKGYRGNTVFKVFDLLDGVKEYLPTELFAEEINEKTQSNT